MMLLLLCQHRNLLSRLSLSLSNQWPFEPDTSHLAPGRDLSDLEVPAFQTWQECFDYPQGRDEKRERKRESFVILQHAHMFGHLDTDEQERILFT